MRRFGAGSIFVLLYRGDYWQCAYVIPKGGIDEVRRNGLDAFRANMVASVPDFASPPLLGMLPDSLKRGQIGMDIADHRNRLSQEIDPSIQIDVANLNDTRVRTTRSPERRWSRWPG